MVRRLGQALRTHGSTPEEDDPRRVRDPNGAATAILPVGAVFEQGGQERQPEARPQGIPADFPIKERQPLA
jgi:hypothetical protein